MGMQLFTDGTEVEVYIIYFALDFAAASCSSRLIISCEKVDSPQTTLLVVNFFQSPGWLQLIDTLGISPGVAWTAWGSVPGKIMYFPASGRTL